MSARALPLVAFALAAAACDGAPDEELTPDPALVDVLTELHLADARAARDGLDADSLRDVALAQHDLDAAGLDRQRDALADDPDYATAVYQAVETRLASERRGGGLR